MGRALLGKPRILQLIKKFPSFKDVWFFITDLGAFAKLRKATVGFVVSVHPYVRMDQLGFQWADFHDIRYYRIFRISVEQNSSFI